ncbi:YSC84-related protein [Castellaniella sp.]|uniref:lipid-binding SYLF domain-containing protein n=1 Tax=Castellaniella sp. TaxID=1955812 RepID=UPI00356B113B
MQPIRSVGARRWLGLLLSFVLFSPTPASLAASDAALEADAWTALEQLYQQQPEAHWLAEHASAILVFPRIVKAGLIVGGERGKGVLFKDGQPDGRYASTGLSYGLQAGAQAYSYALFFMNDSALRMLDRREGWEIGVGPSVVVIDHGLAGKLSSTTLDDDVYAYIFGQKGLMAGIGIQGSKISRLED